MSQRPGRHQRRASQSVFSLPENFASPEDVPGDGVGEQRKPAAAGRTLRAAAARRAGARRHAMAVPVHGDLGPMDPRRTDGKRTSTAPGLVV
uniref:Uncharacterized protein n=1 Tax=Aegilops tauschii TaxID=37682 RepID=M8CD63_AEGTA